jgi:hypothetical protein
MNTLARIVTLALLAPALAAAAPPTASRPARAPYVHLPDALAWDTPFAHRSASLRIVGPGGFFLDREFGTGRPVLDLKTLGPLADGLYTFEVVYGRRPDPALASALKDAEVEEDGTLSNAGLRARVAALRAVSSGSFSVQAGKVVSPNQKEGRLTKDQVIPDDLIVQGSICAGLDCVNNEDFQFDTLRLKENNLRIHFSDTSTGAFPLRDWELRANDSESGGASYFGIVDRGDDGTAATVVFSVAAGAPANALTVRSTGDLGIRTSTPVLDVHARTGDTPGIRLEQDSSVGFTAQTWDMAGNEANFFIRDVTNGSLLSFRIRPGAPSSSLDIGPTGNVGVGVLPPTTEASSPYLFVGPRFSIGTSASAGTQYVQISNNAKFDGANPTYVQAGPANQIYMNGDTTVFRRAASGAAGAVVPWAESFRIDSGGRVGVGATPAVAEANSPYLFVGSRFSIGTSAGVGPGYVQLSNNAIFNGANPTYVGAGGAGQMYMNGDSIVFRRAPSGSAGAIVPWSESLRIDSTGVRVTGNLHVTGTCCGPDYVFDPGFNVPSIEENAAYMWRHRHLPAVGPARTNAQGEAVVNVFAQSNGMLEELEKAHIYIEQLNSEVKSLKAELAEMRALMRK